MFSGQMFSGQMFFAQLREFLPRHEFHTCVHRSGGDSRLRGFSCRDQFRCLAFAQLTSAQLTFRASLRDIETCLRAVESKRYHAGFRGRISRRRLLNSHRGDVDFARRHRFTKHSAFFVTRAKRNLDDTRRESRRVDKTTSLRSDQTIAQTGVKSSQLHPAPLRRVSYHDAATDRRFVFLTNNVTIPAPTVAGWYKSRWQVELFFKGIKQNLRIKDVSDKSRLDSVS